MSGNVNCASQPDAGGAILNLDSVYPSPTRMAGESPCESSRLPLVRYQIRRYLPVSTSAAIIRCPGGMEIIPAKGDSIPVAPPPAGRDSTSESLDGEL